MKNVFILNKIFDRSRNDIEGNISHEIIDFILTDYGKHYVYNVPYGSCPDWITVAGEPGSPKSTHEVKYLILTSECHNNTFTVLYRIKLVRKLHNVRYSKDWCADAAKIAEMDSVYEQNLAYYGGKKISDLLDNATPLITFEAEKMEMPADPIEITFREYRYQRNRGYLKEDANAVDFALLQKALDDAKWIRTGLDPLLDKSDSKYSGKTFLDLLLKQESEECYTNILYLVLSDPRIFHSFCKKFAPESVDESGPFRIYREHKLVDGRVDICAENERQRAVIEVKLKSGLNGVKQDSGSQLSTYYNWAKEKDLKPICFIIAPDYRIFMSHSGRLGTLEREILKYDPAMKDKYKLVGYSEICDFLEGIRTLQRDDYEYSSYFDDIIAAFGRFSYATRSEYYRELLQLRMK